jgi:hypothetical protein
MRGLTPIGGVLIRKPPHKHKWSRFIPVAVSGALSVGSIALVYMFQISIKPAAMTVENGRQFTRAYQGVLGRRHTQRPIQAIFRRATRPFPYVWKPISNRKILFQALRHTLEKAQRH